jgi:hypothetical protein
MYMYGGTCARARTEQQLRHFVMMTKCGLTMYYMYVEKHYVLRAFHVVSPRDRWSSVLLIC